MWKGKGRGNTGRAEQGATVKTNRVLFTILPRPWLWPVFDHKLDVLFIILFGLLLLFHSQMHGVVILLGKSLFTERFKVKITKLVN